MFYFIPTKICICSLCLLANLFRIIVKWSECSKTFQFVNFQLHGRKYKSEFLDYYFSFNVAFVSGKNFAVPKCLICSNELSNASMITNNLRVHFNKHIQNGDTLPDNPDVSFLIQRHFSFVNNIYINFCYVYQ